MQLRQERQAGRGLAFEQHQHDREFVRLSTLVGCLGLPGVCLYAPGECLVVFDHLPRAEPVLADQQHERGSFVDGLGKLRQVEAARAHRPGREIDVRLRVLAPQRRLQTLHEREVLRVEAEKPVTHAQIVKLALQLLDLIRKLQPAE